MFSCSLSLASLCTSPPDNVKKKNVRKQFCWCFVSAEEVKKSMRAESQNGQKTVQNKTITSHISLKRPKPKTSASLVWALLCESLCNMRCAGAKAVGHLRQLATASITWTNHTVSDKIRDARKVQYLGQLAVFVETISTSSFILYSPNISGLGSLLTNLINCTWSLFCGSSRGTRSSSYCAMSISFSSNLHLASFNRLAIAIHMATSVFSLLSFR